MQTRNAVIIGAAVAAAVSSAAYAVGRSTTPPVESSAYEEAHGTEQAPSLPAGAQEANARVANSPRHGEWAMIRSGQDSIRAWVVYPERRDRAPVVVVIHEIFGLSNWIRAVADQLAADGFIAIAPDLLTMKNVPRAPDGESDANAARAVIRELDTATTNRYLSAVAEWGMALPAALPKYGVVGFCWGGSASFAHAVAAPNLGGAVVYYGGSPASASLASVRAPVLGLYGQDDARVNATIPPADSTMKALGKSFEYHIYDGAGHGFLRDQTGREANLEATKKAWPTTIEFFRRTLN